MSRRLFLFIVLALIQSVGFTQTVRQASPINPEPVADSSSPQSFATFLALVQDETKSAVDVAENGDGESDNEDLQDEDPLALADVVASIYRSYPDIIRARQQPGLASGELLSAYGAYDTKFNAFSLSEPTGYYRNHRNGLKLARQTWWGGYVEAGYRIGRGFYQPWYKERQTDDAGEFRVAFAQPLLQGRAIDPQRVAVFQASLAQQAAGPIIQQTILSISGDATSTYWDWVSAGFVLQAQRQLLQLAEVRGEQYDVGVKAGKFAEIDLILNQQLIAERRAKQLESEQKFRATSFKLGLYLRDTTGQPMVPDDSWLPERFPIIREQPPGNFDEDLAGALTRRPEPQLLQLEISSIQIDRQLANNEMLPRFDFVTEASQDMGEPATASDDKGMFELVIGFTSEVPIQRRKARGKTQSATAKIIQTNEKLRLTQDKIAAELRTANNALLIAGQVVEQSEIALRAIIETVERYRFAFDRGKVDLIYLNLLETKENESEIKLVDAQRAWFVALAEMQITLGLDPLERAMTVSALPPSEMPGPGHLPLPAKVQAKDFNRDWKRHSVDQP